jgi:hypothetical protein
VKLQIQPDILSAVYARFGESFDTADLRDAKQLLDSIGHIA